MQLRDEFFGWMTSIGQISEPVGGKEGLELYVLFSAPL